MSIAALIRVDQYSFYKIVMLIVAPLVVFGGFSLALLSYYYFGRCERKITFPLFFFLLSLQVYDLLIFWQLVPGTFTVKWYLPFLLITLTWIYVRRRILEVNALYVDAKVGDQLRKLSHDIISPIQRIKSLLTSSTLEEDRAGLITQNLEELEATSCSILESMSEKPKINEKRYGLFSDILEKSKRKYKEKIEVDIMLWSVFYWYPVDEPIFTRVFSNLINNAIKAKASKITFKGVFSDQSLKITITDDGTGIPSNLQPYIFEKGIKSNKSSGQGLGLNFSKMKLAELNGAIVLKSSTPGKTIIEVSVPFKELVLIDDNPLVRDTWASLAKKRGLSFKSFAPCEESNALKAVSKDTPIFIDFEMGEVSGLDLAKRLRKIGYKSIILSTGKRERLTSLFPQIGKDFSKIFESG